MTRFWRPKPGPLVRRSRIWHVAIGALLASLSHATGGYEGLAWGTGGILVGSFLWEAATRTVIRGWHPYGDLIDLYAFALPCIAVGGFALAGWNPVGVYVAFAAGAAGGHFIRD